MDFRELEESQNKVKMEGLMREIARGSREASTSQQQRQASNVQIDVPKDGTVAEGCLKAVIELDYKMGKKDLIDELEYRGIELSREGKRSKERLVEKLIKEGGGKVRLSKTVVGGLISTLFFNYQKELMKEPFKLEITQQDNSKKKKEINELNEKIGKEKVLEKIKLLNKSSHISNNWFFREVLAAIVNDEERLGKLKAVCTAICKEPMERLLKDVEVGEEVKNVLGFFGVEHNQIKTNAQPTNDSSVPRSRSSSLSSPGGSNNDQPGPSSKLDEVPLISPSQSLSPF